MINPGQLSLTTPDGTNRNIIIEPMLEKDEQGLRGTGVYKLYKDAFGEESSLFTEPLEAGETNDDLPDSKNPDFLGTLTFTTSLNWQYEGDLLSVDEQNQVVEYIQSDNG